MSDGHAETVNVDELEGYLERTGQNKPIEVREACRRRMPLDGTDAMHLEHALQITERERDAALARVAELEGLLP